MKKFLIIASIVLVLVIAAGTIWYFVLSGITDEAIQKTTVPSTSITESPTPSAEPGNTPVPLPDYSEDLDFEFSLSFGAYGRSNINTFEDTITKDLVSAGNIKTEYVMPEYAREQVYLMLEKMDIINFPSDLNFPLNDEHVEHLKLRVLINGEERFVKWTVPWNFSFWGDMRDHLTEEHSQIQELVEYISGTVYESEEWKSLPEIEGGYL